MPDAHANFAYSTVVTAPTPALSGTSLIVQAAEGTLFPTPPFNVTIWPALVIPLITNAEIARCTARNGDTLTLTRAEEGTAARAILVGDQIAVTITKKVITDIEDSVVTDVAALAAHLADTADAHDASAISLLDAANDFTATDVEGALAELQTDYEAGTAALVAHEADTTAIHGIADTAALATDAELAAGLLLSPILSPATAARNTIQPTGAITALTLKGKAGGGSDYPLRVVNAAGALRAAINYGLLDDDCAALQLHGSLGGFLIGIDIGSKQDIAIGRIDVGGTVTDSLYGIYGDGIEGSIVRWSMGVGDANSPYTLTITGAKDNEPSLGTLRLLSRAASPTGHLLAFSNQFNDHANTFAYFDYLGCLHFKPHVISTDTITIRETVSGVVDANARFIIDSRGRVKWQNPTGSAEPLQLWVNDQIYGTRAVEVTGDFGVSGSIRTHVGVVDALRIGTALIVDNNNKRVTIGAAAYSGSGNMTVFLADSNSVPVTNPTGGVSIYSETGMLKWRSPAGVVTSLDGAGAPALSPATSDRNLIQAPDTVVPLTLRITNAAQAAEAFRVQSGDGDNRVWVDPAVAGNWALRIAGDSGVANPVLVVQDATSDVEQFSVLGTGRVRFGNDGNAAIYRGASGLLNVSNAFVSLGLLGAGLATGVLPSSTLHIKASGDATFRLESGAAGGYVLMKAKTAYPFTVSILTQNAAPLELGTGTVAALTIDTSQNLAVTDAKNLIFGTTTGTKIGTGPTQKIGLWGVAPVVQRSAITAPTGGSVQDAEARTAINALRQALIDVGVTA